jgi:A/G-specific adenine glycosylase
MKQEFVTNIIEWYRKNSRDLPWRNTLDPYKVWLSEIILQQTRVVQGLPYYERFISRFPDINTLANATQDDVLHAWQGLGYYSRARNLHDTARYIVNEKSGVFPATYKELIELKGIGDYTASAIASFCHNEVTPVLDGNVYRVMSRYFGIYTPIQTPAAHKQFKKLARELIPPDKPGLYNQAIMEFGALLCTPSSPECQHCPLLNGCYAYKEKSVKLLPVKLPKKNKQKRYFEYLVFITRKGDTYLEKRTDKDIWKGLYQFPLIENSTPLSRKDLEQNQLLSLFAIDNDYTISSHPLMSSIRKLTHREIHIRFWKVSILEFKSSYSPTAWNNLIDYPVPVVIRQFIQQYSDRIVEDK